MLLRFPARVNKMDKPMLGNPGTVSKTSVRLGQAGVILGGIQVAEDVGVAGLDLADVLGVGPHEPAQAVGRIEREDLVPVASDRSGPDGRGGPGRSG